MAGVVGVIALLGIIAAMTSGEKKTPTAVDYKSNEEKDHMAKRKACPKCSNMNPEVAANCPECGITLRHKSVKEAYCSWKGLGVFDLIPGIRDLPYPVRFILMICTVTVLVIIIVPLVLNHFFNRIFPFP